MTTRRHFIKSGFLITGGLLLDPFHHVLALENNSITVNILQGRPTDRSVSLNMLVNENCTCKIQWSTNQQSWVSGKAISCTKNTPVVIEISGLTSGQQYDYQFVYQTGSTGDWKKIPVGRFRTAKKTGSAFCFTVTADSHLGTLKHCDPDLYQQTLLNVAQDNPDLHFALGDDFRSSKVKDPNADTITQLYIRQREHLGPIFQSVPYFFLLGNHELENKANDNGTPDCISSWSLSARTRFLSNPIPNHFYTGQENTQNYYAFEWGDVLFICLDMFRYSDLSAADDEMKNENRKEMEGLSKEERMRIREERRQQGGKKNRNGSEEKKDAWSFSLGKEQYDWLHATLKQSKARYKIVMGHHILGSCRGGIEWASFFEWGGLHRNGTRAFEEKRPDWAMPIHELFTTYKVTAFIQGHDHLFARQEKDGVAYITCPMCGDPGYNMYNADAFTSGDKLPNTGHLRFSCTPNDLIMEYVKSVLTKDEVAQGKNKHIAYAWSFGSNQKIGS